MVYAIPTDPIWHGLYGSDLSAFSIPHILMALLNVFAFLSVCALLISATPQRRWQGVWKLTAQDIIPLMAFIAMLTTMLILLTVDWYTVRDETGIRAFLRQRPDWLPLAFIVFLATWIGSTVNRVLRYYGAATLVGVSAFALRLLLVN